MAHWDDWIDKQNVQQGMYKAGGPTGLKAQAWSLMAIVEHTCSDQDYELQSSV
jgi:hypothetical protein